MEITEKEIKSYIENKNATVISIDLEKGEFKYQPKDKNYSIKGFVENVETWLNQLTKIGEERYEIADWYKEKNKIDWDLLIGEGNEIVIKRETEKAVLVTNNANTDLWIPKSVFKKI